MIVLVSSPFAADHKLRASLIWKRASLPNLRLSVDPVRARSYKHWSRAGGVWPVIQDCRRHEHFRRGQIGTPNAVLRWKRVGTPAMNCLAGESRRQDFAGINHAS